MDTHVESNTCRRYAAILRCEHPNRGLALARYDHGYLTVAATRLTHSQYDFLTPESAM